jgi:hypothetical protein
LRGIKHRRNALAPTVIREYLVQTDRLSADHQKRDMELTSIILSADGSQFLVPSQPVHERALYQSILIHYDTVGFSAPLTVFVGRLLNGCWFGLVLGHRIGPSALFIRQGLGKRSTQSLD